MEIIRVASVSIVEQGKVLLIQEGKTNAAGQWNFPSGRLELGESVYQAACREALEETGLEVELSSTTGVYPYISNTGELVLLYHFMANRIGGCLRIDGKEIIGSKWVFMNDMMAIDDKQLRIPKIQKKIADRIIKERFLPVNRIAEYNS
ncbi:NUDIX hydrolase [Bacillus sp. 1P06AnD]|uniref:NUDIX hydrolase n=1 Tax=Bacillus sp. 1P06AnD TaxID=3132208 RepID=UPI00399FF7CF